MIKRKVLTNILIAGFTLSVVFGFIFVWMIRSLPHIAIAEINDLTNAKVDVNSIDFKFDGSVRIEKLVLRPDQEQRYDNAILKADIVYARFSIGSLFLLRPKLKEVRIRNFVFDAQYDSDIGRWNVAALKFNAPKGGAGKMPFIYLDEGTLQYSKVSNGQAKVLAAVPIDMRFRPAEEILGGYSFDITTAEKTISALHRGQSSSRCKLVGAWRPGRITLAGSISSAGIPAFEKTWVINVLNAEISYDRSYDYSLVFKAKDCLYTQETAADASGLDSRLAGSLDKPAPALVFDKKTRGANYGLFTALQSFFSRYRPAGKVDLDVELSGNFNRLIESTMAGKVYCRDISIRDRKFPYIIEQITGQIDFTENNVILNNLTGRHGDTRVTFNGWTGDFGPNQRYQIQITSDNMTLDNDLYDALSVKQKRLWTAFSPSGQAAIDYRFSRQSQTENKKTLVVELHGARFTYQDFCYPLKNLTGKLLFDQDNIIVSNVVSQMDEGRITFNGKISEQSSDRPIYDLLIKADNVPFDSALARALPVRQGDFFDRFDISGLADANAAIFTPKAENEQISFHADLVLKKTSLEINTLPLVLSDISANVTLTPDSIGIKDLTGRLGQGTVSLAGGIWLDPSEAGTLTDKTLLSSHYYLALSANQAQLNDDLIGLLPTSVEKIVSQWQPEGKVNLSGYLNKSFGQDLPDYRITIDCLGDSVNFKSAKDGFYPLKDVTGRLTITNNTLMFDDITAAPAGIEQAVTEGSTIKLNGQIDLADNTLSEGKFQLSARDISFGDYLACALPAGAVSLYQTLSPTGRFDLVLENVNIFNAPMPSVEDRNGGEKYIDFSGTAKFKACNFNISGTQAQLDAVMKIKALYKTKSGLANGQVSLIADSLKIKDKVITNMQGDFIYNPILRNWEADDLVAQCCGGRISGKLELKQSSDYAEDFLLQVGFDDIDLRRFLRGSQTDDNPQAGYTSGIMDGSLSLGARVGDSSARLGRCRLAIKDMKVGKLSPLAKLLYVLQLKEQKDFAFERMVVDSYLKQNMLFFEKFDLSGEAVAFSGTGWMDMQSENVSLTLTARGQRVATTEPSLIQSLAESLGGAVVRMEVSGNVYDPKVETKLAPVVEDSLKILGSSR